MFFSRSKRPKRSPFVPAGIPSRVKSEFKDEVDINSIWRRVKAGQQPPAWMTSRTPFYGDFSNAPKTFQDCFAIVERAGAAFESLPIEFRRELDHDPRRLASAPRELFAKYGLLRKPEESAAGNPASEPPVAQRVQGEQALPDSPRSGGESAGEAGSKAKK